MSIKPLFDGGEIIRNVNGKVIGEVYPCELGWGYHHYKSDMGYEGMDSKAEATEELIKEDN